jgi:probable HAF family extracellular repeat protein
MKTRWLRHFLLGLMGTLVIALGLSIFTATTAATRFYYSITDLGTLGGSFSYALSMNDMGQIVGTSQTSSGNSQAFLWQGGVMTNIGTASGYNNSTARDINNLGQVLGDGGTIEDFSLSSFLWSNDTITTSVVPDFCSVIGINDTEQIVGFCTITDTAYISAFLFQDGQIIDNFDPLNFPTFARDINNSGQVVGSFSVDITNYTYEAFLWQDGTATELGTLGGTNSEAYAVNDVGQVVGKAQTSTGDFHAFFWDGAMQDLGTLANYTSSVAYGINNRGRVVGKATNSSGSSHAFVRLNNGIRDLNNLIPANSGWELIEAKDINNNGRIIGYGTVNGENHAFVLTPTWVTQ